MKSNDNIKDEFRYFLSKSVKTSRVRGQFFFSEGTIHNYLSFCDQMGKYIEKVTNGKYTSIFDITLPSEIESVASVVLDDDSFIANDKEKNVNGLMSGALMYYVCFVNARDYFTHSKDHDSSIIGTFDDTNTSMKYEDFVEVLRDLNTKFGSLSFYLFGLKYGKWLANINITKLIGDAGLTSSMSKELNKGKRIYEIIANGDFTLNWGYSTRRLTNTMAVDAKTSPSSIPYLAALRTKPFMLLAGISGTGKSRIVREMAFKTCPKYLQDKDGTTPGNYCMIEVKPNWHDSMELIGYYSNLSQSYQFKKFVKFLVKAQMNPEVPFFVCLDEMNLAPVEQYFAEILSILETRNHPKKDGQPDMSTIKTGVIVDSMYFDKITWKDEQGATHVKLITSDADWYKAFFSVENGSEEEAQVMKYQRSHTLQEEGLKLPDNVFIIGTVNMDDTTHPFSRKVIDRAMTIEMNGGRLSDMFGGSRDLEYIEDEKIQKEWQQAFHQHYVTADEVLEEHPEYAETLKEKLPAKLDAINKALKGTPFEVSYRVLNELTIMVGVMLDDKKGREDIDIDGIINHAVDNILLMKILPRIEGDADMFYISDEYKKENYITYDNRLEWLKDIAPDIKAVTTSEEDNSDSTNEDQPTAKKKIKEMIDRLTSQEFTRFWP